MTQIQQLTKKVTDFRDERDWGKFHSIKDLSMALNIETSEILELSLWKTEADLATMFSNEEGKLKIAAELADVFMYLLLLAEKVDIDLNQAVLDKIKINKARFSVEDFHGAFDKSKRKDIKND